MTRIAIRCAVVGALFCLPLLAMAQAAPAAPAAPAAQAGTDPTDGVLQQLGLTPEQNGKVDKLVAAYKQKQQAIPPPGEVLLKDRELVRQLVTVAPFDKVKAEQLTKQASAAIQQRMLNRMELRNQIFQVLTPQQREQYIKKVMEALGKGQ